MTAYCLTNFWSAYYVSGVERLLVWELAVPSRFPVRLEILVT